MRRNLWVTNSQVNEHGIQLMKGQQAYMKPDNSTFHVKLFLAVTVGLASCLWLVGTVLYLDTASGHESTFYALVMNNSSPSVVDNGDRPGAKTRPFLKQHIGLSFVRARVLYEYVLSFYNLLILLLSDRSRPPMLSF